MSQILGIEQLAETQHLCKHHSLLADHWVRATVGSHRSAGGVPPY